MLFSRALALLPALLSLVSCSDPSLAPQVLTDIIRSTLGNPEVSNFLSYEQKSILELLEKERKFPACKAFFDHIAKNHPLSTVIEHTDNPYFWRSLIFSSLAKFSIESRKHADAMLEEIGLFDQDYTAVSDGLLDGFNADNGIPMHLVSPTSGYGVRVSPTEPITDAKLLNVRALEYAFNLGHVATVKYLNRNGVEFTESPDQVMLMAINLGNLELTRYLVDDYFPIKGLSLDMDQALYMAALYDQLEIARYFVENKGVALDGKYASHLSVARDPGIRVLRYFLDEHFDKFSPVMLKNALAFFSSPDGFADVKYLFERRKGDLPPNAIADVIEKVIYNYKNFEELDYLLGLYNDSLASDPRQETLMEGFVEKALIWMTKCNDLPKIICLAEKYAKFLTTQAMGKAIEAAIACKKPETFGCLLHIYESSRIEEPEKGDYMQKYVGLGLSLMAQVGSLPEVQQFFEMHGSFVSPQDMENAAIKAIECKRSDTPEYLIDTHMKCLSQNPTLQPFIRGFMRQALFKALCHIYPVVVEHIVTHHGSHLDEDIISGGLFDALGSTIHRQQNVVYLLEKKGDILTKEHLEYAMTLAEKTKSSEIQKTLEGLLSQKE